MDLYETFTTLYAKELKKCLEYKQNTLHCFMAVIVSENHEVLTPTDIELFHAILAAGIDIDATDWQGDTALHYAILKEHVGILKLLLEKKADITIANKTGFTPPQQACLLEGWKADFPLCKAFLLKGVKPLAFKVDKYPSSSDGSRIAKFYEGIRVARKVTILFIGLRSKCPLLKLIGKDILLLIAQIIYTTRGEPVWNQSGETI